MLRSRNDEQGGMWTACMHAGGTPVCVCVCIAAAAALNVLGEAWARARAEVRVLEAYGRKKHVTGLVNLTLCFVYMHDILL